MSPLYEMYGARARAYPPARALDWDSLALKIALLSPETYSEARKWDEDYSYCDPARYDSDRPHPMWVPPYELVQRKLEIWPLNHREGDLMREALKRLLGEKETEHVP